MIFREQDLQGIQLQKLVAYIIEHNRDEKQLYSVHNSNISYQGQLQQHTQQYHSSDQRIDITVNNNHRIGTNGSVNMGSEITINRNNRISEVKGTVKNDNRRSRKVSNLLLRIKQEEEHRQLHQQQQQQQVDTIKEQHQQGNWEKNNVQNQEGEQKSQEQEHLGVDVNQNSGVMVTEVKHQDQQQQQQQPDHQKQQTVEKSDNQQRVNRKSTSSISNSNSNNNKSRHSLSNKHNIDKSNTQSSHAHFIPHHQHSAINMKSIMLSLTNSTIDNIKLQFIHHDNSINLQQFLFIIKNAIHYNPSQQYQLMYELTKLFQQIDIDCNHSIDWNEFLQYIASYGQAANSINNKINHQLSNDPNYIERIKKPNFIVQQWNEQNKHRKNQIAKIVQIEKLDMLCIVQTRNFTLSFINKYGDRYLLNRNVSNSNNNKHSHTKTALPSPGESNNKIETTNGKSTQPFINKSSKSNRKSSPTNTTTNMNAELFTLNHIDHKKVLSLDYSEHEKLFGVLQTDRKVYFIQEGEIQKSWGKLQGTGNQIDIVYLKLHKKWLLKRIDHYIDIFSSPKDKHNNERIAFKPHNKQAITAIQQIKNPLGLVTASMDGRIKIWTLQSRQLLIELRSIGQQQAVTNSLYDYKIMGVKGLDTLNMGFQSYFCSWTFTTEIMIWLPSASVSKPYIGKLQGHSGIVQSCSFVRPQHCSRQLLVSIDSRRVVKLWSVEKMECLESVVHEGLGCRVMCLNDWPVFTVYDKIIEFNKLRLNSLMLSSEKQLSKNSHSLSLTQDKTNIGDSESISKNNKQQHHKSTNKDSQQQNKNKNNNKSLIEPYNLNKKKPDQQQQFVQLQFCNHNIVMALLLKKQLRIINLQAGRVQQIIEPFYKNQEQFISMTMKINRRVFVLSTLGYVYYIKLDDGIVIKRIEVVVSWRQQKIIASLQRDSDNVVINNNNGNNSKETLNLYKGNNKHDHQKSRYNPFANKKYNNKNNNYSNNSKQTFIPRYVHYHSMSKILLIVVQLQQSSLLITYTEYPGYEFQKMKQLQFPQIDLTHLYFFNQIDLMLIADKSDLISIWDWKKLTILNTINLNQRKLKSIIENKEKHILQKSKKQLQSKAKGMGQQQRISREQVKMQKSKSSWKKRNSFYKIKNQHDNKYPDSSPIYRENQKLQPQKIKINRKKNNQNIKQANQIQPHKKYYDDQSGEQSDHSQKCFKLLTNKMDKYKDEDRAKGAQEEEGFIRQLSVYEDRDAGVYLLLIVSKYEEIVVYEVGQSDGSVRNRLSLSINSEQTSFQNSSNSSHSSDNGDSDSYIDDSDHNNEHKRRKEGQQIRSALLVSTRDEQINNIINDTRVNANNISNKSSKSNLYHQNYNINNLNSNRNSFNLNDHHNKYKQGSSFNSNSNNIAKSSLIKQKQVKFNQTLVTNHESSPTQNNDHIKDTHEGNFYNNNDNPFQSKPVPKSLKSTSKHNLAPKQENYILLVTLRNGRILIYSFNEHLKNFTNKKWSQTSYQHKKTFTNNNQQQINSSNINNNNNINVNVNILNEYNEKKYGAHKMRETRKVNLKSIHDNYLFTRSVSIQNDLLLTKPIIKSPWTHHLKAIYPDMLYGLSESQQIIFLKPSAYVVGEWSINSMLPKKWGLLYQLMPKVMDRLNKLDIILKNQNEIQKKPYENTQLQKILFLANRYLDQKDLKQLKQTVKLDTYKLINMSKKNILFKKSSLAQKIPPQQNKNQQPMNFPISIKYIIENSQSLNHRTKSQNKQEKKDTFSLNINKKSNSNANNNNFFQQKFQQKIQNQNKTKINKRFINKQVENTLNHAKKLQLKALQNVLNKQKISLNSQPKTIDIKQKKQSEFLRQQQKKKQGLNNYKNNQQSAQNTVTGNTSQNKMITIQTQHLLLQQQQQKKQIQKNIDFVKRIQNSIQRIELQYSTNWLKNKKPQEIDQKSKKNQITKNQAQVINKNEAQKVNNVSQLPKNNQRQCTNLLLRKLSITDAIQPDNETQRPKQNNTVKKNVEFSSFKKVIEYENTQEDVSKRNNQDFLKNQISNYKPIRSFSAANRILFKSGSVQKNTKNKIQLTSPQRKKLKSASVKNKKQTVQIPKQALMKSRSLYGSQFSVQKQTAITNFRKGMKQLESFYKKYGPDLGITGNVSIKKNKIKLN